MCRSHSHPMLRVFACIALLACRHHVLAFSAASSCGFHSIAAAARSCRANEVEATPAAFRPTLASERHTRPRRTCLRVRIDDKYVNTEGDADGDWWEVDDLEVLTGQGRDFEDDDEEMEWTPDREKARVQREVLHRSVKHATAANDVLKPNASRVAERKKTKDAAAADTVEKPKASPYTDEEEDLIKSMGGMQKDHRRKKREPGYLGDSTLTDIATDYSVPICYLADVLCMWGVPVPIDPNSQLGDLVTGEQAFAILEAVYSLDVGVLQDRYSNQNLVQVCDLYEIELKDAFQFAMKEGWSLPFGVQTHLRTEQEDELKRTYVGY